MKTGTAFFLKIFLHIFIPLLIGLLIYILYRPDVWFIEAFNLNLEIQPVSKNISPFKKIIIFSGPDFCWSYSFASAIFFLNHFSKFGSHKTLAFYLFLFLISSEILQIFLTPYFTFSISDVIVILFAWILATFLNKEK